MNSTFARPKDSVLPTGFFPTHLLKSNNDIIGRVTWSPDGTHFVCSSQDGEIRVWEVETGRLVKAFVSKTKCIHQIAWPSDQSHFLTTTGDGRVYSCDLISGETRVTALRDADRIFMIGCSSQYPYVAVSARHNGSHHLLILDIHSLEAIWKSPKSKCPITFAWNHSGGLIAATHSSGLLFFDAATPEKFENWHQFGIGEKLAWSPDDKHIFLEKSHKICSFNIASQRLSLIPGTFEGHIAAIATSTKHNSALIASSLHTIHVIDLSRRKETAVLEGHTGPIASLSFSDAGSLMTSISEDQTARIWRTDDWVEVASLHIPAKFDVQSCFHPSLPLTFCLKGGNTQSYSQPQLIGFDEQIIRSTSTSDTIKYTSAKVILVGESNAGKSCIAMRLVNNRYPKDDEQGTTHGLRVWKMLPEQLNPSVTTPSGHRRDIVLWDMGGQDEYRLVHQLFLLDACVALIFLDPTRGRSAYEDVEDWNRRLEKEFAQSSLSKILVGTKLDGHLADVVDQRAIRALMERCQIHEYVSTSALRNFGLDDLKLKISGAINWEDLAKASRPRLFQVIRDRIERLRDNGDIFLYLADLHNYLATELNETLDAVSVNAVTSHLAAQGEIVDTRLSTGERVLILRIDEIERYAGSLIIAARNNPHGIPALEERYLALPNEALPGIEKAARLPRQTEVVILQCVTELLVQSGICFRLTGLLIFPSLFSEMPHEANVKMPQSISLYYDFTGAIDNIYAGLIAKLVMCKAFGKPLLLHDGVKFDDRHYGVCGLRRVKRIGGLGHIDLFFGEDTKQDRRKLFVTFVEEHLQNHGVEVNEHQAIKCRDCGYEVAEDIVQENIDRGQQDIICPRCRTLTLISEGVQNSNSLNLISEEKIFALKTAVEKQTRGDAMQVMKTVSMNASRTAAEERTPVRILHLSDLHFKPGDYATTLFSWLRDDLKKELQVGALDYLVISGDITDKGDSNGFQKGSDLCNLLIEEFGLSSQRCIFVPGNHDIQDSKEHYSWTDSNNGLEEGQYVQKGDVYLVRDDDRYKSRFKSFSDLFFHQVTQRPYPLDPERQGIPYLFAQDRIQFVTLNSNWQIDQFHRRRSSINSEALATVCGEADKQVAMAMSEGRLESNSVLRIGIWHHAINGQDMMNDVSFLGHLQKAGVKICLHGDVHSVRRELLSYWRDSLHICGVGSFGAPSKDRPESTPRFYQLLEIPRSLSGIKVHTRQQADAKSAWDGWNHWPREDGGVGGVPFYNIIL